MEDKHSSKKPLRPVTNIKDVYNTYIKNKPASRSIPISDVFQEPPIDSRIDEINTDIESEVHEAIQEEENELIEKITELETKLADAIREREEFRDQAIRTVAEMENFRKRTLREKQELLEFGNERILFRFLDILDDLGNAVSAGRQADNSSSILSGIEMIYQKALRLFDTVGVKQMESPIGNPFDVNLHEALMVMESDQPEGNVCQVAQAGYFLNDKVLRHAKVITSSGTKKELTEEVSGQNEMAGN
ncbi:MAG: molecular chaperone GrpE [Ignavibacteria bacterium]|nr:molecular chaperone GrpE [Ignavibacteria bacterium]